MIILAGLLATALAILIWRSHAFLRDGAWHEHDILPFSSAVTIDGRTVAGYGARVMMRYIRHRGLWQYRKMTGQEDVDDRMHSAW